VGACRTRALAEATERHDTPEEEGGGGYWSLSYIDDVNGVRVGGEAEMARLLRGPRETGRLQSIVIV